MSTSTEENFKQALKDLQEVNDQLFYGELKSKMGQHLHQLEAEYSKVEQTMEGVHFKLERFEDEFNRITQEATNQMRATVSNIQEDVPNLFEEQLNVMGDSFAAFSELAEEQKQSLKESELEWRELHKTLLTSQKEYHESMGVELEAHLLKQDEILKQHFELSTRWQEQQINQLKLSLSTLAEDMYKMNQEVKTSIRQVEDLMKESSQAHQLQLVTDQENRDTQWKQQKDKIALIEKKQEEQINSTKKWMTVFVVFQVIITGAIVGVYFFN